MKFSHLTYLYLLSFFLLGQLDWKRRGQLSSFFHFQKAGKSDSFQLSQFPYFKEKKREMLADFAKPELVQLGLCYLFGEKRGLDRRIEEEHNLLGLGHLFTPSGLHLSAFYLLFAPLGFMSKMGKRAKYILIFLVSLLFLFLPGFFAIKRMALMRMISLFIFFLFSWKALLKFKEAESSNTSSSISSLSSRSSSSTTPSILWPFFFSFSLDYLWGSYVLSPWSYAYSFLYLGTLICIQEQPKVLWPFAFLGATIIANFFSGTLIYTSAFIFNFLLTGFFGLIYPFIFLPYFFSFYSLMEISLNLYNEFVSFSSKLAQGSGSFQSTLTLVLIVAAFSLNFKRKKVRRLMMRVVFPCFLFSYSEHGNPQKFYELKQPPMRKYFYSPPGHPLKFQYQLKSHAGGGPMTRKKKEVLLMSFSKTSGPLKSIQCGISSLSYPLSLDCKGKLKFKAKVKNRFKSKAMKKIKEKTKEKTKTKTKTKTKKI